LNFLKKGKTKEKKNAEIEGVILHDFNVLNFSVYHLFDNLYTCKCSANNWELL